MSEYLDKAGKADKALEARNTANVALMTANMEIDKAKQEAEKSKLTNLSHIVSTRESGKAHIRAAEASANARGAGSSMAAAKLEAQNKSRATSEYLSESKKLRDDLLNAEKYIPNLKGEAKVAKQAEADRLKAEIDVLRRAAFARYELEPPPSDVGAKTLPPGFKLDK